MIENTSARDSQELTGLLLLATGDTTGVIEAQEAAGQRQLVNSDRLPADFGFGGDRVNWEAVGFTFGDPDPADPMFMPATLPDGWTREGSDHAMWSYITDSLGRRRVRIFYKAAFYDRSAFMSLETVHGYVAERIRNDEPVVTDDAWATPAAIAEAALRGIKAADEHIDTWTHIGNAEYVAQYTTERAQWAAIATTYGA